MNSIETQIAQVEQSIEGHKEIVSNGDALLRLYANRDFKKLVLDGFLKDEAVRLVQSLTDPNLQSAESQLSLQKQMYAISSLRDYFRLIEQRAMNSRKALAFDEETLAEMTAELQHG